MERHLPELEKVIVLEELENGRLKMLEKKRKITLRMLLCHTGKYRPKNFVISVYDLICISQRDSATASPTPS